MTYAVETDDTSLQICDAILSADQLGQQVQILAFKKYVLLRGEVVVDGLNTFFLSMWLVSYLMNNINAIFFTEASNLRCLLCHSTIL